MSIMNIEQIYAFIASLIGSKKELIIVSSTSSLSLSYLLEKIEIHFAGKDITTALFFLVVLSVLAGIFTLIDFVTGITYARKVKIRIQSYRWGMTVGKYVGLTLFFVLGAVVFLVFKENTFTMFIVYSPLILTILKEFISIGENLENINGHRPYIFSVIDRLFAIGENRFFKKVSKDKCDSDEEEHITQ